MIEISQKDFEQKIQDIIDGKTTRTKLITELKSDRDTLNNRIQELVVYNPKLYKAFIDKFPYKPREYTHIDYEALIIDILKNGYTRRQWDDIYEVDSRTITRKLKILEETNPNLICLYREVAQYKKKQIEVPVYLQKQIDDLESKEIFIAGINDKKREELLEKEKQYNEAIMSGMGATEASKKVGRNRVSKAINTLNRIEIERQVKSESIKEEGVEK